MTTKTCPVCGKDFKQRRPSENQTYCSRACAGMTLRSSAEINCAYCGKSMQADRQGGHLKRRKYCSRACSAAARDTRTEIPCSECGTPLSIHKYERDTQKAFYCSRACMGKARSRIRGEDNPTYRGGERLASRMCASCGKSFQFSPSRIHAKFCSKRCKGVWMSAHNKGANHPQYKGGKVKERGRNWQFQRRLALERDGWRCQVCRQKLSRGKMNYGVHHIKPYREFNGDYERANRLLNLITLCRRCHTLVEAGTLDCPQPLL